MVKRYKTRTRPARNYQYCFETICDLCHHPIDEGGVFVGDRFDQVNVCRKVGYNDAAYGGCHTETTVDVCGSCFETKLIPFVKEKGGTPTETEVDY